MTLTIASVPRFLPSPYEPIEKVGAGTFGEVWRARDPRDHREYAVKVLYETDADAVIEELARTRGLVHPNLAVPTQWGQGSDKQFFIVSPFVPGVTLRSLLQKQGGLSTSETCSLMSQVLVGLAHAHRHGVLHRDVKPENVLVNLADGQRQAVLVDFGLGTYWDARRVDEAGSFAGTLRYAAPEQVRGQNISSTADVYAWGLVLLECLVGPEVLDRKGIRALGGDVAERSRILELVRDRGLRWAIRRVTERQPEDRAVADEDLLRALDSPSWMPDGERVLEKRPLTFLVCRGRVSLASEEKTPSLSQIVATGEASGGYAATTFDGLDAIVFGLGTVREDDTVGAAKVGLDLLGRGAAATAFLHVGDVELEVDGTREDGLLRVWGSEAGRLAIALVETVEDGLLVASFAALPRLVDRCDVDLVDGPNAVAIVKALRSSSTVSVAPEATPFVGRREELAAIERVWASEGRRAKLALLVGEAGIGKSRLVREVCGRLGSAGDVSFLRARCLPENQGTPLAAISDMLSSFGAGLFDLLKRYEIDPASVAPALARMTGLELPEWIVPARQTPERERLVVSDALVALLRGLAGERHMIVVVEDLHWIDADTLEYLEKLASSGEFTSRLLLLMTARTSHEPAWVRTRGEIIQLGPLPDEEVEALLGDDIPDELKRRIVAQAEGVPLFAAEVGRMIVAGGDSAAAAATIPVGLRALVAERLAGLSAPARQAAHLASVLGREFDWEIVVAAAGDSVDAVALEELARAGIVSVARQGTSADFRHALIRDAVYDSIPMDRRGMLHRTIAASIIRDFPDIAVKRPELVAQQLELAGDIVESATYWKLTGEKNLRQAAYRESESSALRGLRLVEDMPLDERTGPVQIELLTVIATSQFMVGGYARPEVSETLSRAMVVAEDLGESTPLPVLNGLWTYHLSRSHLPETQQMIGIFEKIATSTDPVIALEGCAVVGVDAWYAGDFQKAALFLERAIELYHRPEFREYADNYGYNGGFYCYPYAMTARFFLGNKVEADRLYDRMQRAALEVADPYSLSINNVFSALYLVECGDAARALPIAERQIALSLEQQLPLYMAGATCNKGIAERMLGDAEQGLATLQYGMAMYKGMGIDSAYANYLTHLGTTLLELHRLDEAEATIEEGLHHCATGHCRYHEPEFHRLRGELLLARGSREAAEIALHVSLGKARERNNVPFQLRAGAVLGRHWIDAGRLTEAKQLLRELSPEDFNMGTLDWRRVADLVSSIGATSLARG